MFEPLFLLALVVIAILVVSSIFMIKLGSKKDSDGKYILPLTVFGWALLAITIVGSIVGLILYINEKGGFSGTLLFTIISPLFIFCGFMVMLGIGITSLVEGYKRDEAGNRNKPGIIRGWFLLFLAITLITAVVVTLAILFYQHSMARGDEPVRFM